MAKCRQPGLLRGACLAALGEALDRRAPMDPAVFVTSPDPLVRRLARRRVRAAVERAQRDTGATGFAPEAALHAVGLAYLRLAGVDPRPMPDAPRTDAAVHAHRDAWPGWRPLRGPWVSLGLLAILALAVASCLLVAAWFPDPYGGPVGRALSQTLPRWVVALDGWAGANAGRREPARLGELTAALAREQAEVLAPEVDAALGEPARAALDRVLGAARELAGEGVDEARLVSLHAALREANEALEAAGFPWFLDADHDEAAGYTQVALFVYAVERRRTVMAGAVAIQAIHVHRVDGTNWVRDALGFTRREMAVALVSSDAVEEALVETIGPALGDGAEMPLAALDAVGLTPEEAGELRAVAGRVAREVWNQRLGSERAALPALSAVLVRRAALLAEWRRTLAPRGVGLELAGRAATSPSDLEALGRLMGVREVRRLTSLEAELDDHADLFARMREILLASVERHEVQHRLDYARGAAFPIPAGLTALTGVSLGPDGKPPRFLERVALETSAYLAELVRSGNLAPLEILLLAHRLFEDGDAGTVEWYAAMAIVQGLADEIPVHAEARHGRRRWAELVIGLTRTPLELLAQKAKALWERWYQADLGELLVRE